MPLLSERIFNFMWNCRLPIVAIFPYLHTPYRKLQRTKSLLGSALPSFLFHLICQTLCCAARQYLPLPFELDSFIYDETSSCTPFADGATLNVRFPFHRFVDDRMHVCARASGHSFLLKIAKTEKFLFWQQDSDVYSRELCMPFADIRIHSNRKKMFKWRLRSFYIVLTALCEQRSIAMSIYNFTCFSI